MPKKCSVGWVGVGVGGITVEPALILVNNIAATMPHSAVLSIISY